jgi:hypothetical protein
LSGQFKHSGHHVGKRCSLPGQPFGLESTVRGKIQPSIAEEQIPVGERRVDTFFYGLLMDADLLREGNVVPVNARRAFVEDFTLRIGERATLVATLGARAYGMVFALMHRELDALYSAAGLEQYRPEALLAQTLDGPVIPALCYNLVQAPEPVERNPQYAVRLQQVLRKLAFPPAYIESIS